MLAQRGRTGRPYVRLKARVFREESHCWVCGAFVDQTLHHNDPMARTLDHVRQLVDGGDLLDRTNARLAHRRCNTIRSNKLRSQRPQRPTIAIDPETI